MSTTNSKLLIMVKTQSQVCRSSKAGEEKDRDTDISPGFTTHLASGLGKKDRSWLRRKEKDIKVKKKWDVSEDSICLTARIVQEFGDDKVASSGRRRALCSLRRKTFFHYIAFSELRIARQQELRL